MLTHVLLFSCKASTQYYHFYSHSSTGAVTTGTTPTATPEAPEDPTTKAAAYTSRDEIVPCDCVLLRGKAVVNEASLTGTSLWLLIVCFVFRFDRFRLTCRRCFCPIYKKALL